MSLDRAAVRPLAAQLADGLRAAAASGALRPGDRLPSTRELAVVLRVSRTVTAAAYDQLYAEGWASGRTGVGTFVTGAAEEARSGVGPEGPVGERAPLGTGPAPIDLRPGAPCLEVLDRAAWRRAWRAAGDLDPDGGPDPVGDRRFRAAVAGRLLRPRGLAAAPDDVLATAGTSSAIAEVARLLPPGSRVAVEDPGYRRAVGALRDAGMHVVGVPLDDDGLLVDAVPAGVAAVYCTPAHQFPLGRRMSAARRVALVGRARAEGWWVLEDDYDGELRYDVAPLPLLAALAPDVVVHLGTSSKIVSPTLGAGWLVAPPPVRAALMARRTAIGARPGRAGQRVFAALAESGDLARHLRRLRKEFAARRAETVAAIEATGRRVQGDPAGAHVFVALPDPTAERELVAIAAEEGVLVAGLADQLLDAASAPAAGLVLGFAAPPRADLTAALALLGALLGR